jgi:hypothetical protein
LVWKQTTGSENGIYTSAAGAWTKIASFTAGSNVVLTYAGTLYGKYAFVASAANTVVRVEAPWSA